MTTDRPSDEEAYGVRATKLLVACICVIFAYLQGIAAYFPYRATNDETYVFPDLHALFAHGHIDHANYFSGIGYQLITTVLLRVTGLELSELQALNPIIATIAFATLILVYFLVYSQAVGRPIWWGFAAVPPAFFVFAGYVNRIRESTHKGYTQVLLVVGLYLAYRTLRGSFRGRRAYRPFLLLFVVSGTISLFNYVWGFVYSGLLALIVLQRRSTRTRAAVTSIAMALFAVSAPITHPAIRIHDRFERTIGSMVTVFAADEESDSHETGSQSGSASADRAASGSRSDASHSGSQSHLFAKPRERISQWPSVSVPGTDSSLSLWYVYTIGVLGVASLTLLSAFSVVRRCYRRRRVTPTDRLLITVWAFFGLLGIGLLAAGETNTFRRIIVIPGVFGVLHWVIALSDRDRTPSVDLLPVRRETMLKGILVFLLVSSALATNRTLLDGHSSPYDIYADEHEVEKFRWIDSRVERVDPDETCLRTHREIDGHLSAKVLGYRLNPVERPATASTVYTSGRKGRVSCVPNP